MAVVAAVGAIVAAELPAAGPPPPDMIAVLAPTYEVPMPRGFSPRAGGDFRARYDPKSRRMTWTLGFHNLTGPAKAAHIHLGAFGKAGRILIPLCGPCLSGTSGSLTLTHSQASPKRPWYVNVHTSRNPSGEIRGQLVAPEIVPPGKGVGGGTHSGRLRCCPSG